MTKTDSWVSTTLREEADAQSAQIGELLQEAIAGLDQRMAQPPGSTAALAARRCRGKRAW